MNLLSNLALGLGAACTSANLLLALLGSLVGLLAGVLPRVGPVVSIAMLLPAVQGLAPLSVLILLACVVIGAQRGGVMAAVLLKPPMLPSGSGFSREGYPVASQGQGGAVLAANALGSVCAACVLIFVVTVLTPLLLPLVSAFGPAEYCGLMLLGLMGSVVLASGPLLKAIAMVLLGLLLGLVGTDGQSGVARFDGGLAELANGLGFVAVAMGVFGYGAVISNLAQVQPAREVVDAALQAVRMPSKDDLKAMAPAVLRGSAHTALLPLMSLGLPLNAVMALLVGAMGLHQVPPGPLLLSDDPALFWGLLAAIGVGNLMLLVLGLPLVRLWTRVLMVPYRWVAVVIVLLCALGAFSMRHSAFDVWLVAGLGCVGYLFNRLDLDPAPLLLGFVLAPRLEDKLREALLQSHGDWAVFVSRPVSGSLLFLAVLVLCLVLLPAVGNRRRHGFTQG